MKDFYNEVEPYNFEMTAREYYEGKRNKVLATIKPICNAFGIKDYDYICNLDKEKLIVEGEKIDCSRNSIGAIVMELINYIWINTYATKRSPKDVRKSENKQTVKEFAEKIKKRYGNEYRCVHLSFESLDSIVEEVCGE